MEGHKLIFKGRIIQVGLETVDLPNGRRVEIEMVRHPGGAGVVALNTHGQVCLLHQYRHAAGGWIWEIPAGKLDPGEMPATTALRELAEEAGLHANTLIPLGEILSSPGVFDEVIHLFLARELKIVPHQREVNEIMEVHWVAWPEALNWARTGQIRDAKTLVGLYRAQAYLGGADGAV